VKARDLIVNVVVLVGLGFAVWWALEGRRVVDGTTCEERGGERTGNSVFSGCLERATPDPRAAEILRQLEEQEAAEEAAGAVFGDYCGEGACREGHEDGRDD